MEYLEVSGSRKHLRGHHSKVPHERDDVEDIEQGFHCVAGGSCVCVVDSILKVLTYFQIYNNTQLYMYMYNFIPLGILTLKQLLIYFTVVEGYHALAPPYYNPSADISLQ